MSRNNILILLMLSCTVLFGQKKEPNFGMGITFNTTSYFLPPNNWWARPIIQVQASYLPKPNQIVSLSIGASLIKNSSNLKPKAPIWTTIDYMKVYRYDKKKKTQILFGGNLNVGFGEFIYARDKNLSAFIPYYKRFLISLSPQIGLGQKIGKRSYFNAVLSTGFGSLFLKSSQLPTGSIYYDKVFSTFELRISFIQLFNIKK